MKLRMSHLALLSLFAIHGYASNINPLPVADKRLVERFQLALDAVFGIGIRLQAFLQDEKDENFLVSPISATVIIGQLILGAEGEFREQLVELLSLPNSHLYANDKVNHYNKHKNITYDLPYSTLHLQLANLLNSLEGGIGDKKHFILKQKNAVFLNNQVTLKHRFVRHLRDFYYVQVHPLNFAGDPSGSKTIMNEWASKNTNGLIKTIVSEPPTPETASIFANAVYFFGEWATPFSDELNRVGTFNVTKEKQVEVTYMIGLLEQIPYAESNDYRMVALPYKNDELGMYILLPKATSPYKYDIRSFMQNVKSSEILETIAKAKRRDVVVKIPKMTVSHSFSILDQLKKYRVFKRQEVEPKTSNVTNVVDRLEDKVDAFTNFTTDTQTDVYLSNAAVDRKLRIDDIVQQVVITVNEKGTEAAAVTVSTIDYMGGSKNFLLDRPFAFFIRHEATSATLFWGTISNPVA